MKILVTGGAGFIGGNLLYQLIALGGDVYVIDDLSTGDPDNLDPRAKFRKMDICSDEFRAVCNSFKPEVIVHLAAQSSVVRSITDPEENNRINVEGTRNVVEAAIECGAKRLIFASTAAVYGNPVELPLREDSPLAPLNPYGQSKLEGEAIIEESLRDTDIDFAILRFANVYGPRQGGSGEGGVISIFCTALAEGGAPSIEGDGTQTRDFIFVSDVVQALISTIGGDITFKGNPEKQAAAGRYNIGTGKKVSIKEIAASLRMAAQFFGAYGKAPAREGDIRDSVLDSTRALETFEFEAAVELNTGLELSYNWFKKRFNEGHEEVESSPQDDILFGDPVLILPKGMPEFPGR